MVTVAEPVVVMVAEPHEECDTVTVTVPDEVTDGDADIDTVVVIVAEEL